MMKRITKPRNECFSFIEIGLAFVLIIFFFSALSCSKGSRDASFDNLIIITLDTTRADHLGCYGQSKAKTPILDQCAAEGVIFENAVCPSPSTVPSHATIMTGMYPPRHGVRVTGRHSLPSTAVTMADVLKKEGYKTGAVISGYPLTTRFGVNKGFDFYEDSFWKEAPGKEMVIERIAEKSVSIALNFLEKNRDSKFFLWLHLYDPHSEYTPPPPFDSQFQDSPYDGEIAYMDWSLGIFFKKLKEWNILDRSLIVVTGDHGEGLGEHGESEHQYLIYDSTVKVPLLIQGRKEFKGKRISDLVGLVDIFPTVMDLLKIKGDFQVDGRSLKQIIENTQADEEQRFYYVESLSGEISLGWSPLYSLMDGEWKFIEAPEAELYSLKADPAEMHNRIVQEQERAETLRKKLNEMRESLSQSSASSEAILDEEAAKNLASLGYISSGTFTRKEGKAEKDPKKYIFIEKDIQALYKLFLTKQYDAAFPHIDAILKADPDNRLALLYAGTAYFEMRQNDKALPYLERLYASCQDLIGNNLLIRIYESQNKIDKALEVCDSSIVNFADKPQFHRLRGMILANNGKYSDAIKDFKNAISLDSTSPEIFYYLARCYAATGNEEDTIDACRTSLAKGLEQAGVYLEDPVFRNLKRFDEIKNLVASSKGKEVEK